MVNNNSTVEASSSSDVGPLVETLEFFESSHGSYQHLNFLPYSSLSAQYSILISLIGQFSYGVFGVPFLLDFLRRECKFFIQTSPLHLTSSLMRLYSCLMDEIRTQETAEGSDRMSAVQVR